MPGSSATEEGSMGFSNCWRFVAFRTRNSSSSGLWAGGAPVQERSDEEHILAECSQFALTSCRPAVTDAADTERRVRAAFRYEAHISDRRFIEWFCITPAEMLLLPDWFRTKPPPKEPRKIRIRSAARSCEGTSRLFDASVSSRKRAALIAERLKEHDGIDVQPDNDPTGPYRDC